jgi:hypothetical protein
MRDAQIELPEDPEVRRLRVLPAQDSVENRLFERRGFTAVFSQAQAYTIQLDARRFGCITGPVCRRLGDLRV